METLLDKYVINGGPLMVLLVPCSLLMLGAVLQGMIRLRRSRVMPRRLIDEARSGGKAGGRGYIKRLREDGSPLARALWLTVRGFETSELDPDNERFGMVMEESIERVGDEMSDGLSLLMTLYTITPLLGVMGTILGMMETFLEFALREERSLQQLSVGIQQALVTSLWGLGIAIPAFVAAMWFQSRIRRYERDLIPAAMLRIIRFIRGDEEKAEAEAGSSSVRRVMQMHRQKAETPPTEVNPPV